jgi:hypothetical protein
MSFDGKTIVITGGSSGIGLATAEAAIAKGAAVVITGRDRERLDRALSQLGGRARGFAVDAHQMKKRFAVYSPNSRTSITFSATPAVSPVPRNCSARMWPRCGRRWRFVFGERYMRRSRDSRRCARVARSF